MLSRSRLASLGQPAASASKVECGRGGLYLTVRDWRRGQCRATWLITVAASSLAVMLNTESWLHLEKDFIPGGACKTHLETRSTIVAVSASASPRRERDGHREGSLEGAAWILQMWNKNHYLAKLRKPRHTRLIVQSSPILKYFNTLMLSVETIIHFLHQ